MAVTTVKTGGAGSYDITRGPQIYSNASSANDQRLHMMYLEFITGGTVDLYLGYSDDYGANWSHSSVETLGNPTTMGYSKVDFVIVGDYLHAAWIDSDGSTSVIYARSYNMDTGVWGTRSTVHAAFTPYAGQLSNKIEIVARSSTANADMPDGLVVIYGYGPRYRVKGNDWGTTWCSYKASGSWTNLEVSQFEQETHYLTLGAMLGSDGADVHLFWYQDVSPYPLYRRTLTGANSLTTILGNNYNMGDRFTYRDSTVIMPDIANGYAFLADNESVRRWLEVTDALSSGAPNSYTVETGATNVYASYDPALDEPYVLARSQDASNYDYTLYVSTDDGVNWTGNLATDNYPYNSNARISRHLYFHTNGDKYVSWVWVAGAIFEFDSYLVAPGVTTSTISHTTDLHLIELAVNHTTDLRVGYFVDHTTDVLAVDFASPTDTGFYSSITRSHKTLVLNDRLYIVGLENTAEPDKVRLWQSDVGNPASGNWTLFEFTEQSGTSMGIKDVAMVEYDGIIHIVYIHHDYGGDWDMYPYHSEFDPDTEIFTHNGSFGTLEFHTDWATTNTSVLDLAVVGTELVAIVNLRKYTSWVGSYNTYRHTMRVYRSSGRSFASANNDLYHYWYGNSAFSDYQTAPQLWAAGTDVYISLDTQWVSRYDSGNTEGIRYPAFPHQGQSSRYTGSLNTSSYLEPLYVNGRFYVVEDAYDAETNTRTLVMYSAAAGGDELVWDQEWEVGSYIYDGAYFTFVDHYGRVGVFHADGNNADESAIYENDGFGNFYKTTSPAPTTSLSPSTRFPVREVVGTTIGAWEWKSSGNWTFWGHKIPTWHIAHTTDLVVSSSPVVYHTTDMVVAPPGPWGQPFPNSGDFNVVRDNTFVYNSNYYTVMFGRHHIEVFESARPDLGGVRITQHGTTNVSGATGEEFFHTADFVHVAGVIHCLVGIWVTNRTEFYHWEYNIGTDIWTDNGSIRSNTYSGQKDYPYCALNVRQDGTLIAFMYDPEAPGYWYALDSGAGFGAAIAMTGGSTPYGLSIAVDGNDAHLISYLPATSVWHWHLSSTDVLGAVQSVTGQEIPISGFANPVVNNGTMYFPFLDNLGSSNAMTAHVLSAPTGSDAPTWTLTQVASDVDWFGKDAWMVADAAGQPTLVYRKHNTDQIWMVKYDGSSWNAYNTSVEIPQQGDGFLKGYGRYVDANDNFHAWWFQDLVTFPSDVSWHVALVNLNPTISHTTDLVTIQVVFTIDHTTDARIAARLTVDHTTDLVVSTDSTTKSINHNTDLRVANQLTVDHTADLRVASRQTVSHTADLFVVDLIDISTALTASAVLSATTTSTTAAETSPAKSAGEPRTGDYSRRVYRPERRIVEK